MNLYQHLSEEAQDYVDQIRDRLQAEAAKPLTVAVMGQTGVGKSSLINALFDTRLPTDPVRPCTMEPAEVTVESKSARHPLTFVDLPGVGESAAADPRYFTMYRRFLDAADVVLWAVHADSRSLAGDVALIHRLLNGAPDLGKITFVLTKADLVHADPWIVPLEAGLPARVTVQPGPATADLLAQKIRFVRETFGATPAAGSDEVVLPIACSSVLRYNLAGVMTAVVDRLNALAIRRLIPHLRIDELDLADAQDVLATTDVMVLDLQRRAALRFADLVAGALAAPVPVGGEQ
ncbi:50S ribosome-binding GTPase [Actinoplanes sp. KI2]|uniref:GTPase family protein n=1 Tax=Actinoplanes sp. KI2 TaxID=2983315 RepID=UPI0021D58170|nr:GTPase [Actinoplanes sp. KI2]MCU7725231.1 50S ribosome-binding GTPase [Actinoplanes sp. KI2]